MKRLACIFTAFIWMVCAVCVPCAALVTQTQPPLTADDASLLWSYVPGTSYRDAPSVPVWYDGRV